MKISPEFENLIHDYQTFIVSNDTDLKVQWTKQRERER